MAEFSLIVGERYKRIVEDLWPQGIAWRQIKDSNSIFAKIICLIASEVEFIDKRISDFKRERNPKTVFEMLEEWEEFLGIPDECTPQDVELTLNDRRVRLCQKLTTGGGQSAAFYKLIASQLGFDADVLDVQEFTDFRVGQKRVGDRLTNGSNPATGWTHTFAIVAPATLVQFFTVGQSTVGERLVFVSNETLECVIEQFKPAHTNVIFSFGEVI